MSFFFLLIFHPIKQKINKKFSHRFITLGVSLEVGYGCKFIFNWNRSVAQSFCYLNDPTVSLSLYNPLWSAALRPISTSITENPNDGQFFPPIKKFN